MVAQEHASEADRPRITPRGKRDHTVDMQETVWLFPQVLRFGSVVTALACG
jgi:hypothetical protein